MNEPKLDFLIFDGGLDQVSTIWEVPPGYARDALNFEVAVNGGYQDLLGYERYDGRASPSDAHYYILSYTLSGTISVGDTLTGATSLATGYVIAVTAGYLVLTRVTGIFILGEDLTNGGVQGVATSTADIDAAGAPLLHATYTALAADGYRVLIQKPTGSGSIRGVWVLADVVYCVRDNAGATAANVWKGTAGGWSQIDLGYELAFTSGGTYEILEGNTITGATSAKTAVVRRVQLVSGTWAGGDAAGWLVLNTPSGAFQAENLDVGANLNVATIAGDAAAITLLPGGLYETDQSNMGGAYTAKRVYGANGTNYGFEFDGTTWARIRTGMVPDTPNHVAVHKLHLFFAFGSSVQHSAPTRPYVWSPILGAAELNAGDTVTGFRVEPGEVTVATMGVYCRNQIKMLYGNTVADWNFPTFRNDVGAYAGTIAQLGYTMFYDDRGVNNLKTTQQFGNFTFATLSDLVIPYLETHGGLAVAAIVDNNKNQYRLFFSDGYALFGTLLKRGKRMGFMPVQYPDVVTVAWSGEQTDGMAVSYVGTAGGYVMQLERGTSFDGVAIESLLFMPPHFLKSNGYEKTFKGGTAEVFGSSYAEFSFGYELNYNEPETAQAALQMSGVALQGGAWDSGSWDTGFWDARSNKPVPFRVTGTAESIAYKIVKDSNAYYPVLFTGIRTRHMLRRQVRHR